MQAKASSKTVVTFKLNLFLLSKSPFVPRFFFVDYGRGSNNLIPTAFFPKKFLGYYICRIAWSIPKCRLSLIRILPYMDRIASDYRIVSYRIRFCPYTGKYRSEKAHISRYFTHSESKEFIRSLTLIRR